MGEPLAEAAQPFNHSVASSLAISAEREKQVGMQEIKKRKIIRKSQNGKVKRKLEQRERTVEKEYG